MLLTGELELGQNPEHCKKMNKPVYLGMSVLDINKTPMYEFCYDYIKPKYKDKAKLCYTDTDSFFILIFTENFLMLKDGLIRLL